MDQLVEIGSRIRFLREIMDYTPELLAQRCGMTVEQLDEYENGTKDFSFSVLYNIANVLGVDVLDLMSGDSPKLSTACVVKSGGGYEINRRSAYSYKHLAFAFRNKVAEPFMVEVQPNAEEIPVLHAHEGQEFNYIVEGSMQLYLGEISYVLEKGDSIYFNSGVPHAMKSLNGQPTKFLAVVMNERKA